MEDLVDDFLTFYIAGTVIIVIQWWNCCFTGHETTANTLSFALIELLRNPEMMEMYEIKSPWKNAVGVFSWGLINVTCMQCKQCRRVRILLYLMQNMITILWMKITQNYNAVCWPSELYLWICYFAISE